MTSAVEDTTTPSGSAMDAFKDRLFQFATQRRRGIRNPFVIVPVDPELEQRVSAYLADWAKSPDHPVEVETLDLESLMVETEVFETVAGVSGAEWDELRSSPSSSNGGYTETVTRTMQENLTEELVEVVVQRHPELRETHDTVVLLLNLGALHPFARASALFDELDRQRVRATIGIPFPGRVYAGKLAFFGRDARHYYPAHRIDRQIDENTPL